jgi:hypothetical protein
MWPSKSGCGEARCSSRGWRPSLVVEESPNFGDLPSIDAAEANRADPSHAGDYR